MADFEHDPLTQRLLVVVLKCIRNLARDFRKIYAKALQLVLYKQRLTFVAEKEFDVAFDGQFIGKFSCDLLVKNKVIVELKSVTALFQNCFRTKYYLISKQATPKQVY